MAGNVLSNLFTRFSGSGRKQSAPSPEIAVLEEVKPEVTWLDCRNPARLQELLNMGADPNGLDEDGLAHIFHTSEYPESARLLVDAGADVNARNGVEATPLFYADPEVSQILIDAGADLTASDHHGRSALHVSQSPEKLEVLIAAGANVNARDHQGRTPLHQQDDYERTIRLIAVGSDINARDREGNTPLHLITLEGDRQHFGYNEALLAFIGAGADCQISNNEGRTVEGVLQSHEREALYLFTAHGKEALEEFFDKDPYEAVERGDIEALGAALDRKRAAGYDDSHLAYELDGRRTMLKAQTPDMVAFLVGVGASVNVVNDRDQTPLQLAYREGDVALAKALLKGGAYTETKDQWNTSPLREAIRFDSEKESVELIRVLAEGGANLEGSIHTAVGLRNGPAIRELVSLGADINERDSYQQTPLFDLKDDETARLVVSLGADIHAENINGQKATDPGQPSSRHRDAVQTAHRAKRLESLLPRADAWKPPEGGYGADARREIQAAVAARESVDAQSQDAPRLRPRF